MSRKELLSVLNREEFREVRLYEARAKVTEAMASWYEFCAEGDPLGVAVYDALTGIHTAMHAGDAGALDKGPAKWARKKYGHNPRPRASSRSTAARELVETVGRIQKATPESMWRDESRGIVARVLPVLEMIGPRAHLVPPLTIEPNEMRRRVVESVDELWGPTGLRTPHDAKAFCVRILVGWGLTTDEARNALKDKDT